MIRFGYASMTEEARLKYMMWALTKTKKPISETTLTRACLIYCYENDVDINSVLDKAENAEHIP